ncbi:hypothetical protein [Mycolicibacterium mucogenicum]|uniref:hypothetical protein n=1 Tax=Mycolicibacterium mucogenicum TaxID=56689 RepID=UPI000AB19D1D|nr:hypothetical protein [Mycolicibacterium mucogenicum]
MSYGEPELVPGAPIVIGSRMFNPNKCVHYTDPDEPHNCVHDWRIYWGNQKRPT